MILYNDAGLLYCGNVCLSSVIYKIVEYYEEKLSEMKEAQDEDGISWREGYDAAVSEIRGFIQSM